MSLKKYYFDKNIKCCSTCMYIDEYTLNVNDDGDVPHGWDGSALCCAFKKTEKVTNDNKLWIFPSLTACKQYKRCTERQANYLDIYDYKKQEIIENPNDISKIKE